MIRKELGPEAVIVSTLESPNEIRVTAALEDDVGELNHLSPAPLNQNPGLDLICERLEFHNIPMELSEKLIESCSHHSVDNPGESLVKSLAAHFQFASLPSFQDTTTPTILVGPPGVGKTITIARLACLATLQNHPVHVVTADAQKAGAISQISSFAKALSLEVSVASTQEELTKIIQNTPQGTSLLIDTPGINPYQPDEIRKLGEIILAVRVSPILTLPAGGDAIEQREMIDSFATLGANRVILTKMDFSRRIGGLLDALHKTQVQLIGYGNSPLVAQPLHNVGPKELALLLLDNKTHSSRELAA